MTLRFSFSRETNDLFPVQFNPAQDGRTADFAVIDKALMAAGRNIDGHGEFASAVGAKKRCVLFKHDK